MNTDVGRARIGQWYERRDKGEIFQVVGYDSGSRTIEIQTFDGDVDEIDLEMWSALPLALAEQPEDWTGPVDDVERDDLGYTETEMRGEDWAEPLRTLRPERQNGQSWQEATTEDERAPEGDDDAPTEEIALEDTNFAQRLR